MRRVLQSGRLKHGTQGTVDTAQTLGWVMLALWLLLGLFAVLFHRTRAKDCVGSLIGLHCDYQHRYWCSEETSQQVTEVLSLVNVCKNPPLRGRTRLPNSVTERAMDRCEHVSFCLANTFSVGVCVDDSRSTASRSTAAGMRT
eukprot:6481870-Amphidinium_carterae.1